MESLNRRSGKRIGYRTPKKELYNQDFRHFDNLIWQVPTWSSAIFMLAIVVSNGILQNAQQLKKLGIDPARSLAVFLFSVFIILILLGNVLIRFRLHQGKLGSLPVQVPRPWWQPRGHTCLLLIIFIEAVMLLDSVIVLAGFSTELGGGISFLLLLFVFPTVECIVLKKIKEFQTK